MEPNQERRKLRVLCLHGYRQNATTFREKTGALRKAMKSRLEFEFLSAPLTPNLEDLETADSSTTNSDDSSAKAWWFSKEPATFSSKDVTQIATGFQESLKEVMKFVKENGPFDGLLGFSQGASMAHLLLAFTSINKDAAVNFKFVVLFSAFKSLSSVHQRLINVKIVGIPSFHVYGETDEIVSCDRSKELAQSFNTPEAIEVPHPGKHCVPPLNCFKKELLQFLNDFTG